MGLEGQRPDEDVIDVLRDAGRRQRDRRGYSRALRSSPGACVDRVLVEHVLNRGHAEALESEEVRSQLGQDEAAHDEDHRAEQLRQRGERRCCLGLAE